MYNMSKKLHAVFTLNGVNSSNSVKIVHTDNITLTPEHKVEDVMIERYDIMPHVCGEMYQCNITDVFLTSSKKLPMMYVNVIHDKPLKRFLLFRLYLCFTIEKDVKDIKNLNQLLNHPISGKFSLETSIDGQRQEIDADIGMYTTHTSMRKKLVNFTLADDMKALINVLVDDVNQKQKEIFEKEYGHYKPPEKYISLRDYKV